MNPGKVIALAMGLAKQGSPVKKGFLLSLQVGLNSELPKEYDALMDRFGPFTTEKIDLYHPCSILWFGAITPELNKDRPDKWPAVPIGSFMLGNKNQFGYLREENALGSEIVVLRKGAVWANSPRDSWIIRRHESLYEFLKTGTDVNEGC